MVKYVAAALLCHYAGKDISEASIKAICEAAGASFDAAEVAPFLSKVSEMGIESAIAEGSSMMAAAPAASMGAAAPSGGAGPAPAAAAAEEKKEPEEEEDEDMGFSLFD